MDRFFLILFTLIVFTVYGAMFHFAPKVKRFQVETEGQMSYGLDSAKVNVIVFEEFACFQCRRFHNEVMPELFGKYVNTGKVKLTLIPVAYLDPSLPAFSAACCISKLGPKYLKAFLDHVFEMSDKEMSTLSARELAASFASTAPKISLNEILQCTKSSHIEEEREKSIAQATALYDENIHMPTLLVNGRIVSPLDKQSVFSTIEKELYDQKK